MSSERIDSHWDFYSRALIQQKQEEYGGWNTTKVVFADDVQQTRVARLAYSDGQEFNERLKNRIIVDKVLAAELFPLDDKPSIVIAETELETHEDIRERNVSSEKRLSGEVVTVGEYNYFMVDAFLRTEGPTSLSSELSINEVADMLLEKGYIPVNANFEIIRNSS